MDGLKKYIAIFMYVCSVDNMVVRFGFSKKKIVQNTI